MGHIADIMGLILFLVTIIIFGLIMSKWFNNGRERNTGGDREE